MSSPPSVVSEPVNSILFVAGGIILIFSMKRKTRNPIFLKE
jgi:hypothetical protein